jgi:hypothetical protein
MTKHRKRKKQVEKIEYEPGIIQRYWAEITILIVIVTIAIIRYRLISVPLERDEGEYAYMGQLLLQGILPYAEAYNMKFPGIYFIYALILSIFGQTHISIHLALLVINAATIFLIYLLGKNLFDSLTGTLSGIGYGILSLSPSFQGLWANSEHFVVFFAVGGILLLIKSLHSDKTPLLFWSGILLGLSFTTKQHGILFTSFGVGYFIFTYLNQDSFSLSNFSKKLGLLILGIIIPFGLILFILAVGGVLDNFWFWAFEYASEYASMTSFENGLLRLKIKLPRFQFNISICIAAALGIISPLWDERARSKWLFSLVFFLASIVALSLGFHFRTHYFILLFPSFALLSGIGITSLLGKIPSLPFQPKKIGILSLAIIITYIYPLFSQGNSLFQLTPLELCRKIFMGNPFPESIEIANYIKQNSSINDRIAIIGSEPQIYFYSNRRAATGYIDIYALMESHPFALDMQKEMIQEVEEAKPKYLVYVNSPASWMRQSKSNSLIFEWLKSYLKNYECTLIVDIVNINKPFYIWGKKTKGYMPKSDNCLLIYKAIAQNNFSR